LRDAGGIGNAAKVADGGGTTGGGARALTGQARTPVTKWRGGMLDGGAATLLCFELREGPEAV